MKTRKPSPAAMDKLHEDAKSYDACLTLVKRYVKPETRLLVIISGARSLTRLARIFVPVVEDNGLAFVEITGAYATLARESTSNGKRFGVRFGGYGYSVATHVCYTLSHVLYGSRQNLLTYDETYI